jgi:hypothetical protein
MEQHDGWAAADVAAEKGGVLRVGGEGPGTDIDILIHDYSVF